MKKIFVPFLLCASVAKADGNAPPSQSNSAQCVSTLEIPSTFKALQNAVGLYYDLGQVRAGLKDIADALAKGPSSASNPTSIQAQAALDVIDRLNDATGEIKLALDGMDAPENVLPILTQAQGRLTAALAKFRLLKRMDLDEETKVKVACLELKARDSNNKLKEIFAGLR